MKNGKPEKNGCGWWCPWCAKWVTKANVSPLESVTDNHYHTTCGNVVDRRKRTL